MADVMNKTVWGARRRPERSRWRLSYAGWKGKRFG